jgi:hypothetical protein
MPSPNEAQSALPLLKLTKPWAQIALDPAISKRVPKPTRFALSDVIHSASLSGFSRHDWGSRTVHLGTGWKGCSSRIVARGTRSAHQFEEEIEAVGRELSRAVGLGGRDRRALRLLSAPLINVTRAIKVALERIAEHNPALATLLTSSIRTRTFCSFTPDSRLPASWQL